MRFIILNKEQAEVIKGNYGSNSELCPLLLYRQKYLLGQKVPFTEIAEYGIWEGYIDQLDLKDIVPFLKFFPIYDADYYLKELDNDGKCVRKIYCDNNR